VSLRRDDTYLGLLTEMFGQPYIWASAGSTDRTHQSERLEGSDCADFVVYGARRMGKKVPYVWTGGLAKYTKRLAKGAVGDKVPFTRAGDLILFPRHVGVLVEDRGTIGIVDDDDIMMHTLFDSPKEQRIGDSGYQDKPIEILRWK
jgi:cell wall-associated NlpC family hydrolase